MLAACRTILTDLIAGIDGPPALIAALICCTLNTACKSCSSRRIGETCDAQGADHATEGPSLNLSTALPVKQGYYHFAGSLTTPPCSEEVNWFVVKSPIELSAAQLKQFHHIYQHNARPIQKLNHRVVTESL